MRHGSFASMPSDIHIYVRFEDQCVFAGEQLHCNITFKNVAHFSEPQTPALVTRRSSRKDSIGRIAALQDASGDPPVPRLNTTNARVDRLPSGESKPSAATSDSWASSGGRSPAGIRPSHKHQRSVSIISLNSPVEGSGSNLGENGKNQRVAMSHRRSSTIQVHTGRDRRPTPPQREGATGLALSLPSNNGKRSPLSTTASSTPAAVSRQSTPDFQFPSTISKAAPNQKLVSREPSPRNAPANVSAQTAARIASTASQVASERSSGEFYSLSNHSQETLMSEQPSILSDKPPLPTNMTRRHNRIDSQPLRKPQAVNLLMGYAHLNATFTLDGSLVDQSQFDEVKQKGFLGGQAGGGVVGIKKSRPSSGFMSNFNFSSIGSLVSGESMSSVKEMKAVTNSRAIPLLSTPQSLLFVDLHLEPGQEKTYSFTTVLPRGLPSSYRGKSIRISYNILVGVQGVPGDRDVHRVRQICVPVRVFSGVDSNGEILGHDLMQPHIVLRDVARTKSIDPSEPFENDRRSSAKQTGNATEFVQYIDTLLDRNRRRQSSSGAMDASIGGNDINDGNPSVQAINRAIMLSNQLSSSTESSTNRFEISKGGTKAAVITIDRSLHRLGETVTAVIDFSEGQSACASLHATLETVEKVSYSLAIRSAASINRVTRRIYSSHTENTLFSRRAVFSPTIPAGATPTFVTSGISLDWGLKFEFGTLKPVEMEEGEMAQSPELFEKVLNDERGSVKVAVERLDCENFEVTIPLTVYGDVVPTVDERDDIEGIAL